MTKNRFALLTWVIMAIALYIFGNDYGTRVILAASIAVPAIMIVLAGLAARSMSLALEHPTVCKCGETVEIRIVIKGRGLLPGYVHCRILCENLLTGESYEEELNPAASTRFTLSSNSCGVLAISIVKLTAVDLFSLSAWDIKKRHSTAAMTHLNTAPRDATSKILVMPTLLNSQLKINPSTKASLESEEYSMHFSGSDPSETFAIREYRPGDPLKSIHWKLSQKTDKLLVRELGMPVDDRILLLLETSIPEGTAGYDCISAMAAALYSISHELITQEISHSLGWMETVSTEYKSHTIASHGDLDIAFSSILANTVKPHESSTIEAYGVALDGYDPSHVVIAGLYMHEAAAQVFGHCTVTLITNADDIAELEI